MAKGELQVRVVKGNNELPISNATVIISGANAGGGEIIEYKMISDSLGNTEIIELETPDILLSLSPLNTRPYSLCDIKVTAEGYNSYQIRGVQIFPMVLAVQHARLNPKNSENQIEDQLLISEPTLIGNYPEKVPESATKLNVPVSGGVDYQTPMIPYSIVVHLGAPNDNNAKNVNVRFIDYIKTVCAGEIYPTWPEAAIRAFSYCIVSFILNRIYTEWYKRQGKDFHITNDPIYDPAFFYGRTTYKSISEIVNFTFNTYITIDRKKQPILTQYSDGIKVIRNAWLSKWGCKFLADEGLNPIEIIKKYYGNSMSLGRTDKFEGITQPYPGSPLTIEDKGSNVRIIQGYLNKISEAYPLIPKVTVNGIYDLATAEAVRKFQNTFKASETGIVDFATWYSISRLYVHITKISV